MRFSMAGVIASAGFASGDRFVVGHWHRSPVGPLTDVMWATPSGERVLLAPSPAGARFVAAVYGFDRVEVVPIRAAGGGHGVEVETPSLHLRLRAGRGVPLPLVPTWFVRRVQAPIAWRLLHVRTHGHSPTGVEEWYRATWYRPVVEGRASLDGRDLGGLRPVDPPVGVGFSEPPRRPSIVSVRPVLVDAAGAVAAALAAP